MERETKELALVVVKNVAGELETNIEELAAYVDEKLKDYDAGLFEGDSDAAKKARAELNKSQKAIAQARIALVKELWKPYEKFEGECKAVEGKIGEAAAKLDAIVKEKENLEKADKRLKIEAIWNQVRDERKFALFTLERIFDSKWLNKTKSLESVKADIVAAMERAESDVKRMENIVPREDLGAVIAFYSDRLNLSLALEYAQSVQKARERRAQAPASRPQAAPQAQPQLTQTAAQKQEAQPLPQAQAESPQESRGEELFEFNAFSEYGEDLHAAAQVALECGMKPFETRAFRATAAQIGEFRKRLEKDGFKYEKKQFLTLKIEIKEF